MNIKSRQKKEPSLFLSLVPIVFMAVSLYIGIAVYEADPHIPLLLSGAVATVVALYLGYSWKELEEGMLNAVRLALQAILILMIIGSIIGSWIAGGIVPTMIYYGLNILSPEYFLIAACAISCIVALASGNAWTAAGTIGIAIMGIGQGLGMNMAMVAGAVISGVYFGDKISPLSETTNMAPGVTGAELFEHIRHMLYTTLPALALSLILYAFLGFHFSESAANLREVAQLQSQLNDLFVISPWLLLVPLLVIVMMVFKIPAIPGLTIGSLVGAVCTVLVQGSSVGKAISVLYYGYSAETGVKVVDNLLNNGGMESMMYTVALILIAMSFGGILETSGIFRTIVNSLLKLAKTTGSLISTTVATCLSANVIGCDQYLSILIPGRMYASVYKERGLKMKNLSRTLEDAGTMTSPLVPWNTCGAFMTATLGVSTLSYAPYAFLAIISPLVAILYGFTGFKIEYEADESLETEDPADTPRPVRQVSG
ncbi:NhaC family Na+:H+ antiporter [Melghirimyces profundicolus]|uniref:NhaC family Na+:H+ antiporter n=1 Tax=Melghirimyces profundicolus TaxID=1242148 RepID=A0A2T6BCB7_9BACL|nr:Na+/H+ antiporter NhaC [Melghirimyces profundicolus]PTX53707.1 NhaC family Na+:H+ antiporter [Melghirimyces profundicolus]